MNAPVLRNPRGPTSSVEARILDTARAHVQKFGAKRVTVVAIAEELGMTHANVYRYFPSKAGLLDAVTTMWLRPLEARLREVAEGADPAADKLERLLMAVHGAYRRTLETEPKLFDLLVDAVEKARPVATQHRARVQGEVQRIVEDGVNSGGFAFTDRRRAMALIFDVAHRFIHPAAMRLDRDVQRAALANRFETALGLVMRALRFGRG
jgi:AcrR family transcriptional regulator